ncbi:MAG: glutathione S-transferase family protein [Gammaproteobacteria bacterium]|jgi:glutathione S-transferase|nr:glutathione S-transferase [Gammaproteobacteria bacterium]MBS66726.1 glutathione S-transferase [Gammaproteobacteria bacterium]|tara:strand:+ start:163 stop:774 length:612 start_codon:yes stop_codon:yes gene_type:complete
MKLYDSIGPNPHVVRMFIAELGLDIEKEEVDLMGGENRQAEHLSRNPSGQMPTLELDDGSFLAEITVICEYLDEINGNSDLIGKTPQERAETKMWVRRIDLQIIEPLTNGFRSAEGYEFFKERLHLIPQAADDLKAIAQERLAWLDQQLEGKEFICGDRLTLADIMLYCFLNFGATVGQPINEGNKNISALYAKLDSLDSASA